MPMSSGLDLETGAASLPVYSTGQTATGPRVKRRRHRSPMSGGGESKNSWPSSIHHQSYMFLETKQTNQKNRSLTK